MPPTSPSTIAAAAVTPSFEGAEPRAAERAVAVEAAVNIVYGTVPYAVMMATPADLEDFAVGFSLTEGVVAERSEIRSVVVETHADGLRVLVDLVGARF